LENVQIETYYHYTVMKIAFLIDIPKPLLLITFDLTNQF